MTQIGHMRSLPTHFHHVTISSSLDPAEMIIKLEAEIRLMHTNHVDETHETLWGDLCGELQYVELKLLGGQTDRRTGG